MRGVLGIASHHAIAGARRKATSGLHDRRSSSLSRMAYMLLDSVRRELLGESPISNSEECGAHSPDRSLCSMKLRLRFFLRAKSANSLGNGAPGRTRTCDPRLRRPMRYPGELRARPSLCGPERRTGRFPVLNTEGGEPCRVRIDHLYARPVVNRYT